MTIPPPTPADLARDLEAAYAWSVGESDTEPAPGLLPAVIRRAKAAEAERDSLLEMLRDEAEGVK